MKTKSRLFAFVGLWAVALAIASEERLTVGWHDEMDRVRDWKPLTPQGGAEVFVPEKGLMGLRIGKNAMHDKASYSWSGAHRVADVDLDRYPFLAVRVAKVSPGAWWTIGLHDYGLSGEKAKSKSGSKAEVVLIDVPAETRWSGKRAIEIRLHVGGFKPTDSVEYDWVRFVRREDAERLRDNPEVKDIRIAR